MMRKSVLYPGVLAGLVLFQACTTQMYVSNAVNAPLLKEKGEVQVALTQNDLQAAVAVGNNVALMANGFYRNYLGEDDYRHNGLLGEVAIGYFKPLAGNFVFETYVGGGAGRVYKQETFTRPNNQEYQASFTANAAKLFIQPDLGIKTRFFDAVISSRFSFVKYNRFSSDNYSAQQLESDFLDNNRLTGPVFMFAEPALTFRGGYKYIKLQFQYGLTVNMTPHRIRHGETFSSVGIILDIARWYDR
jgi:hypothetical protein